MRCLVRRYVTTQQRKAEDQGVTEDDVNEVKQAVTSFRSELFDILKNNGMKGVKDTTEARKWQFSYDVILSIIIFFFFFNFNCPPRISFTYIFVFISSLSTHGELR